MNPTYAATMPSPPLCQDLASLLMFEFFAVCSISPIALCTYILSYPILIAEHRLKAGIVFPDERLPYCICLYAVSL